MLFAKLGRHPIQIDVKVRMINCWTSILNGKQTKLAFQTYLLMYKSNHNTLMYDNLYPNNNIV